MLVLFTLVKCSEHTKIYFYCIYGLYEKLTMFGLCLGKRHYFFYFFPLLVLPKFGMMAG